MREIKLEVRLVSVTGERGIIFPPVYLCKSALADNGLRADPMCETCAGRYSRARPPRALESACFGLVLLETLSNLQPMKMSVASLIRVIS